MDAGALITSSERKPFRYRRLQKKEAPGSVSHPALLPDENLNPRRGRRTENPSLLVF
jgi:hypothetical protein